MNTTSSSLTTTTQMLICGILFVLLAGCGEGSSDEAPGLSSGSHPLIVIAVDGLRTDYLGCYGGTGAATPNIDAFAAESVRFEWAFSQAPAMTPALASLLSSLYPTTHGLRSPGDYLADEAVTLAEVLADAGVPTAAFVRGAPGAGDYGLAQGFASYQTGLQPGEDAAKWMRAHAEEDFLLLVAGWSAGNLSAPEEAGSGRPEGYSARVQEALASRSSDSPILLDDEDLGHARWRYKDMVEGLDVRFGKLMAELRDLGLDSRATVVLLATNGLALQEHDDLFGESVYTPVTRVPAMVRLPGGRDAQTVSKIVETMDLMPTLLELAGHTAPAGAQGKSLVPMLGGGGSPPYIAFSESTAGGGQRFVALGGLGMVSGTGGEAAEIYNLASDPLQLENLSAAEGDKMAVMIRHLEAWEKMVSAVSLDPELRTEQPLDEDTLEHLKSLGYIQ